MRLLIIEDEEKTASYLKKGLSSHAFVVDIAPNGIEGLFLSSQNHYDLVILDVMLPGMNGWEIIKELRHSSPEIRILFLTAKDSVEDRVKGLNLGADDYLVKPFAFSELLARIRSLLHRQSAHSSENIQVDDIEIDLIKHKAIRGNIRLNLTPKEFLLLTLFAQHPGEILSRTLIAERVWDIHFDSDTNVIDVVVRRLRQKVDGQFEKKLIHTVRGLGYVFESR